MHRISGQNVQRMLSPFEHSTNRMVPVVQQPTGTRPRECHQQTQLPLYSLLRRVVDVGNDDLDHVDLQLEHVMFDVLHKVVETQRPVAQVGEKR